MFTLEAEQQIEADQMRQRLIETAIAEAGSQGAFAELLGMSDSNFSQYVSGKRKFAESKLALRLFNYGINVDWVITGRGSRYADNEAGRALQRRHNESIRYASKNVSAIEKLKNYDEELNLARGLQEKEADDNNVNDKSLNARPLTLSPEIAQIRDMLQAPVASQYFNPEVALIAPAGLPTIIFDLPNRNNRSSLFFVAVKGSSMMNLDIHEGDILMMQRQTNFKDKDIILARIEDTLTIKQVKNGNGYLLLNPANPDFEPIKITPELDFECMGVYTNFKRRD